MAQVMVTIHGRRYPVACDDGQEAHVARLADYVDRRLGELAAKAGPQVNESLLLVLTNLLIADELTDAYEGLAELRAQGDGTSGNGRLGDGLDALAARVEALAARLERA
ncbi:MAG: cell division protein ZapA [Rhodospirillaceae bacterium]|nr:cell division protein ZapA [Rhodospirillaceae bacterium]